MKSPKIQRWIDLLATLLAHRYPVTLEDVFGILIRTVEDRDGGPNGYQLLARRPRPRR